MTMRIPMTANRSRLWYLLLLLPWAYGDGLSSPSRRIHRLPQSNTIGPTKFFRRSAPTSPTQQRHPEVFGESLFQTFEEPSRYMPSHVRYSFIETPDEKKKGLKALLQRVSTMASLLCLLDCTLLPLVTILFPILGATSTSSASLEWLHHAGHMVALGFVLPIGILTTALNYSTHQKNKLLVTSLVGLSLILLANGGGHLPMVPHFFHHGSIHRVVNIVGCALLLTSNYLSHRLVHKNCDC